MAPAEGREPEYCKPLHIHKGVSCQLVFSGKRRLPLTHAVLCLLVHSWLEAAENLAYPASLQRALGQAFGYSDTEAFKQDVEQFSLLRKGKHPRQHQEATKASPTACLLPFPWPMTIPQAFLIRKVRS